jgi:hypothetical protein
MGITGSPFFNLIKSIKVKFISFSLAYIMIYKNEVKIDENAPCIPFVCPFFYYLKINQIMKKN